MNKSEWIKTALVLKTAYEKDGFLGAPEKVNVWYEMLKDLDGERVAAAAMKHICTQKWPPTIAEIRALAVPNETKPWGEAWEDVLRAIRLYGIYDERGALDSMEPQTKATVKRLGWKNLCISENVAVDRANFRMIYEADQEEAKRQAVLPEGLRRPMVEHQQRMIE